MGQAMELRHLRYFVAVAEERSLTLAAERRLHTSQPSLSRQIRDLEYEVGAQLMTRSARGVELTEAGPSSSITPGWRWLRSGQLAKRPGGPLSPPSRRLVLAS